MGQVSSNADLLDAIVDRAPEAVRGRLRAASLASRAGLPLNMDAWDGYPAARERLLASALNADANLISLAGDTHNAWAFDLTHDGMAAGVEFGGQSVTSPGFETYLPGLPPEMLAASTMQVEPAAQMDRHVAARLYGGRADASVGGLRLAIYATCAETLRTAGG